MITWPNRIVEDLAARRAVLFLGSGISNNSTGDAGKRPSTWWSFLQSLQAQAKSQSALKRDDLSTISRLLKENDLLTVCDILKAALGREAFVDAIKSEFKTPRYKPAPIHESIYRLDSRIVITPNFDEIYENLAIGKSSGTATVKSYLDDDIAEGLRGGERVILKMHGSVSRPHDLIFTRSDYAKARSSHRSFYSLIESLLRTHTFLFIGCGLSDPDIRLILEDYSFGFLHSKKHFFTIPTTELGQISSKTIGEALGIDFLKYSSKNGHQELTEGLANLQILVDQKRAEMADSQSW